jgi:hypothetical protein
MIPMMLATPLPKPRTILFTTFGFAGGAVMVALALVRGSTFLGLLGRLALTATTLLLAAVHLSVLRNRHRPSKQL